jgi:hypothetical protein
MADCAYCAHVRQDLEKLHRVEQRGWQLWVAIVVMLMLVGVYFTWQNHLAGETEYYLGGFLVCMCLAILGGLYVHLGVVKSKAMPPSCKLGLMSEKNGTLHLHHLDRNLREIGRELRWSDDFGSTPHHDWIIEFSPEDQTHAELLYVSSQGVKTHCAAWRISVGENLTTLEFHDARGNVFSWRSIPRLMEQDLHRHVELAHRYANLDHFLEQARDVALWSEEVYVRLLAIHLFIVESGAHVRGGLAREIYGVTNASLRALKELPGGTDETALVERAQCLLQELRPQLNLKHGPRQEQTT